MQVSYIAALYIMLCTVSYPREWVLRLVSFTVEAEQKNAKFGVSKTMDMLKGLFTIREYQNFLEEGKLAVDGASVASTVSHHYPDFWHYEGIV